MTQDKFSAPNEQKEVSVDTLNDNLTAALTESAAAVGKATRRKGNWKTKNRKELIAKRKNMKV